MSMSNTTENAVLKAILQGTDPPWRAGATQYLALFTADPGETASLVAEANYTGYYRVALTKATAWTDGGSAFTNAALTVPDKTKAQVEIQVELPDGAGTSDWTWWLPITVLKGTIE